MTRLAGLVVLSALAIPANASHPNRTRQEKPRPTQSAEPPLAPPAPIPQATPMPAFAERVLNVLFCPAPVVVNLVVTGRDHDLNQCRSFLRGDPLSLREARENSTRAWINIQPSVLLYQRLDGAVGP
jgi:hypothetical protein